MRINYSEYFNRKEQRVKNCSGGGKQYRDVLKALDLGEHKKPEGDRIRVVLESFSSLGFQYNSRIRDLAADLSGNSSTLKDFWLFDRNLDQGQPSIQGVCFHIPVELKYRSG